MTRTDMKMAKETWIQGVEACIRKNNNQKAYQLVKDLATDKQLEGKSTTRQHNSGKCLIEDREILSRGTEYCSDL